MRKQSLTYKFQNPNTQEETEKFLLTIWMEANEERVMLALDQAIGKSEVNTGESQCL